MDSLPADLINYVLRPLLEDIEVISLFECNQNMHKIKGCLKNYVNMTLKVHRYSYLISKLHVETINEYNTFIKNLDKYNNVTYLKFGDSINQPINLPNSITVLTFGDSFNQFIVLPDSITDLTFGNSFNQFIVLPNSIRVLTFGYHFNQLINLPNAITVLTFGDSFNQPIVLPSKKNKISKGIILPNSIMVLKFGNFFKQPLVLSRKGIKKEYYLILLRF
jgi:hypothetical protein